jgi:hypothetical protein
MHLNRSASIPPEARSEAYNTALKRNFGSYRSSLKKCEMINFWGQMWCFTPEISTMWDVEIGGWRFKVSPDKERPYLKKKLGMVVHVGNPSYA